MKPFGFEFYNQANGLFHPEIRFATDNWKPEALNQGYTRVLGFLWLVEQAFPIELIRPNGLKNKGQTKEKGKSLAREGFFED